MSRAAPAPLIQGNNVSTDLAPGKAPNSGCRHRTPPSGWPATAPTRCPSAGPQPCGAASGTMVVRRLWTTAGDAVISGTGYGPGGEIRRDGDTVTAADAPELAELLRAAVLCNDAALRPADDASNEWLPIGDPTEVALLTAANKLGIDHTALRAGLPRRAEVPFDSDRKRMTTVHRQPDGGVRIICKGAPERCCAHRS